MKDHFALYCDDVKANLKHHRLSWTKAITAFGHDRLLRFYQTGNMASRTAEAMKFVFNERERT